jgi:hypothetical protein
MTNPHAADFGVLRFTPIESFVDPYRGLGADARVDKMVEDLLGDAPSRPEGVADWPRVETAIRRNGLFVVETVTPSFTAMLRFDPEHPDRGDYEIHRRPHGVIEKGRTTKVRAVAPDEKDYPLSMLTPFATRYAVETVGTARLHTCMKWLVGLKDFRTVDEDR